MILDPDNTGTFTNFVANLTGAPQLSGTSVVFGEENKYDQDSPLPMVCFYPREMKFNQYENLAIQDLDPNIKKVLFVKQDFVFEIWAESSVQNATEADNADAAWVTMSDLSNALYYQQAIGYKYTVIDGAYAIFEDAITRHGRGIKLIVRVDLPVVYTPPQYADVTAEPITVTLED